MRRSRSTTAPLLRACAWALAGGLVTAQFCWWLWPDWIEAPLLSAAELPVADEALPSAGTFPSAGGVAPELQTKAFAGAQEAPGAAGSDPAVRASTPARPAELPPELASVLPALDARAARVAEELELVAPAVLDSAAAHLAPRSGETPREFARRSEDQRRALAADALLLEFSLSEIFGKTIYPAGFPVEELVVEPELQRVHELTPEQRSVMLTAALDHWEPRRAEPQFHPPESGRIWHQARLGEVSP